VGIAHSTIKGAITMSNDQHGNLNIPTCNEFPRNLDEMKGFLLAKGFELENLDSDGLSHIIHKVNQREKLNTEEIKLVHDLVDLGDTCGCDSDHRIRDNMDDGKKIGYAR